MGVSDYQRDDSGAVRARLEQIRRTLDQFGPRVVFAPQFGVAATGTGWNGNKESPRHIDAHFSVSVGAEAGRQLDGAIRTFITGQRVSASALVRLAEEHLNEQPAEDSDRLPTDLNAIEWVPIRVQLDGTPIDARHVVFRGYECIAFAAGERAVSSIFSVFDVSRLEARFVTASRGQL
jgi:hypothetical protein